MRPMLDRESICNFLKRIDAEIELNDRIVRSFPSFPIERNGCEEGSIKIYPGGYIRFFGLGPSALGGYIHFSGSGLYLFFDFAEKDSSAQIISGKKYGRNVSPNEFFELLRINMPHHFEWCLWNFV